MPKTVTIELDDAAFERVQDMARLMDQAVEDSATSAVEQHAATIADILEGIREADAGEFATR